jgi:hypothetical protein
LYGHRISKTATKEETMKIRAFNPTTVIAVIALLFSLTGTAVAGALVTGANVKNGSLTGVDVKNGSLGSVDIKNGTIKPIDIKGGMFPTGPQGPEGPQGQQGPGGPQGPAGLSGLQVVTKHSATNSLGFRFATAICPAGKKVLGGGAYVTDGGWPNEIGIVGSYPTGAAWSAAAQELVAFPANWRLTVYAICATVAA